MALITQVAHSGGVVSIYDAAPNDGILLHGAGKACTLVITGADGATRTVSVKLDRYQLRAHIEALMAVHDAIEATEKAQQPPAGMGALLSLLAGKAGAVESEAEEAPQAG